MIMTAMTKCRSLWKQKETFMNQSVHVETERAYT